MQPITLLSKPNNNGTQNLIPGIKYTDITLTSKRLQKHQLLSVKKPLALTFHVHFQNHLNYNFYHWCKQYENTNFHNVLIYLVSHLYALNTHFTFFQTAHNARYIYLVYIIFIYSII